MITLVPTEKPVSHLWLSYVGHSLDRAYWRLGLVLFAIALTFPVVSLPIWIAGSLGLICDEVLLLTLGNRIIVLRDTKALSLALFGNVLGGLGIAALMGGILLSSQEVVHVAGLIAMVVILIDLSSPRLFRKISPVTWVLPLTAVLAMGLSMEFAKLDASATSRILLGGLSFAAMLLLMSRNADELSVFNKLPEARADVVQDDNHLANLISHEIRTPLNAIYGTAQLMRPGLPKDQKAVLRQAMLDAAAGLRAIVENTVDYSKLDEPQQDQGAELIDVQALIEEVVAEFDPIATRKGVRIRVLDIPKRQRHAHLDRDQVAKVLYNLISNALKFTHKGEVRIRVQMTHLRLTIEVADTGIGIPKEYHGRIFLPYEKAETTGTKGISGLGLGLTISRAIASRLGGSLDLDSREGLGSVFTLTIPVGGPAECSPMPEVTSVNTSHEVGAKNSNGSPRLTGVRVLVVDDAPMNRVVLRAMLEREGAEVLEAEHGAEALEYIDTTPLDIVLLDNAMPVMTGHQMLMALRARNGHEAFLPVIGISAGTVMDEVERFRAGGLDAFLPKPVVMADLIASVETHIERPRPLKAV